jgi:hypothetical protein
MRIVVSLVAFVTAAPLFAAEPEIRVVEQLLERMAKTYAECRTYQDSGIVRTDFVHADPEEDFTTYTSFTTAFVRGDAFRFEFGDADENGLIIDNRCILHRRGIHITTHWDINGGFGKVYSLADALGGAAGISDSTSRRVPPLLLPKELPSPRLSEIKEPKWIEDAEHDGVACYRVEGKRGGGSTTLWIDKQTFLLRRIDSVSHFKKFRADQTTTFLPVMNKEVAAEALRFDPKDPS